MQVTINTVAFLVFLACALLITQLKSSKQARVVRPKNSEMYTGRFSNILDDACSEFPYLTNPDDYFQNLKKLFLPGFAFPISGGQVLVPSIKPYTAVLNPDSTGRSFLHSLIIKAVAMAQE